MTVQGSVKKQQPDGMSHGGGGGDSPRDNFAGNLSPFRLVTKFSSRKFFVQLGHFLLLVYPPWRRSPGVVALLSAASVFGTSVHVALLGSEKLVVVCELGLSGTFLTVFPVR